jgi:SNF2 family DNA or RNA helicase
VVVLARDASHDALRAAINDVRALAIEASQASSLDSIDPWDDFLQGPAAYYSWLHELGFNAEDEEKAHGELPEDVVEAIRAFELDTSQLNVPLRGYQHFAARFSLVQKKVVIGDEMGLGKTIEALAALAHLSAKGLRHSLVVCPAAVVTNWTREALSKSMLDSHRLHGPDRSNALRSWIRRGGVAVTTYESLGGVVRTGEP